MFNLFMIPFFFKKSAIFLTMCIDLKYAALRVVLLRKRQWQVQDFSLLDDNVFVRPSVRPGVFVRSEMLLQPQRRVEEAVGLRVRSGQRVSVFWEPQQSGRRRGMTIVVTVTFTGLRFSAQSLHNT